MFETKKKNPLKKIIIFIIILIIVAVVGAFASYQYMDKAYNPLDNKEVTINISKGFATISIGKILEDKKAIRSSLSFRIISKLEHLDGKYKAGIYKVKPNMKVTEIAKGIADGSLAVKGYITIPEGYTNREIEELLVKKGVVLKKYFENELQNGKFDFWFTKDLGNKKNRLEGFLYPDTYDFTKYMDAKDVIARMLDNFDDKFDEHYKKKLKKSGKSLNEIMTVASIVQAEARYPEDFKKVASVVYNRLKKDMPLGLDTTILYAKGEKREFVYYKDLDVDSNYNTYKHTGLPPTPICNPGIEAIEAALEPSETDYLYFIVDKNLDGKLTFSKNYEDFLKDKKAYTEAIKKRDEGK